MRLNSVWLHSDADGLYWQIVTEDGQSAQHRITDPAALRLARTILEQIEARQQCVTGSASQP